MKCVITGVERRSTPEELVRQQFCLELMSARYGYGREALELELPVKMGSGQKWADVGIFQTGAPRDQHNAYIIVECKRADISASGFAEAHEQLRSYMAACLNAHYGMVVAGLRRACIRKIKHPDGRYEYSEVSDIPHSAMRRARFTMVDSSPHPSAISPRYPQAPQLPHSLSADPAPSQMGASSSPHAGYPPPHGRYQAQAGTPAVVSPAYTPIAAPPLLPSPVQFSQNNRRGLPVGLVVLIGVMLLGGICIGAWGLSRSGRLDVAPGAPASRPNGTRWATVSVPVEKKNGVVRAGPSAIAPIVGRIPNGSQVQILDARDDYRRVQAFVDGTTVEGWMHKTILLPPS